MFLNVLIVNLRTKSQTEYVFSNFNTLPQTDLTLAISPGHIPVTRFILQNCLNDLVLKFSSLILVLPALVNIKEKLFELTR